jgi:hypothetical protein
MLCIMYLIELLVRSSVKLFKQFVACWGPYADVPSAVRLTSNRKRKITVISDCVFVVMKFIEIRQ